ncbi:hypothetical protein [Rubritalea tangerina]
MESPVRVTVWVFWELLGVIKFGDVEGVGANIMEGCNVCIALNL